MSLSESFSFDTDQAKLAIALVNPSKEVRDATIANMSKYFNKLKIISELNMLKLWKALYYCLWLADKDAVQRELCVTISQLLHSFSDCKLKLMFCEMFFVTILREWTLVDQYRANKLYILIRMMLREMFVMIVDSGYDHDVIQDTMNCLENEVLTKTPNGVRYHISDIYLEEMGNTTNGKDAVYQERIMKRIFLKFLSDYACDKTTKNPNKALKRVSSKVIQAIIFELASSSNVMPDHSRKRLYMIHKEYQKSTGCNHITVSEALGSATAPEPKPVKPIKAIIESPAATPVADEKSKKRTLKETATPTAEEKKVKKSRKEKVVEAGVEEDVLPAEVAKPAKKEKEARKEKEAKKEKEVTTPSAPPSKTAAAIASEKEKMKAALANVSGNTSTAAALGVKASSIRNVNGVIIETIKESKFQGPGATNGKRVRMHYTGRLKSNNKIFDSSVQKNRPFTFKLGVGEVIRGWDIGVLGMKVGEKRILTIPPEKGYGRHGSPPVIPGNAVLVFDVECLAIQ